MKILNLIPRPIRDIVLAPYEIWNKTTIAEKNRLYNKKSTDIETCGEERLEASEKMLNAIIRLALVAAAMFTLMTRPELQAAISLVGLFISVPSILIFSGSYAGYLGVSKVIEAYAIKSFAAALPGVFFLLASWQLLETHDSFAPSGIIEKPLKNLVDMLKGKVIKLVVLTGLTCCCYTPKEI